MAARKQKKISADPPRSARPTVADTTGDELGAAEMNRRVSEALRRVRKARDLSLDQLALKSGVSRAALSQIEGGRTNPTLSVLWKVAVGLGIPFPELLEMPEASEPKVMRSGDAVALRSADGRMESRLVSPGGAEPAVEVYELRFAPKAVAMKSMPSDSRVNRNSAAMVQPLTCLKSPAQAASSMPMKTSGNPGRAGSTVPTIPTSIRITAST